MDAAKMIAVVRGEMKNCAESLLRAAEICDTAEEIDQLNACIQSARSTLQNVAFLIGKAIQERDGA